MTIWGRGCHFIGYLAAEAPFYWVNLGAQVFHSISYTITKGSTICHVLGIIINTCHSRVFFNNRECVVKSLSDGWKFE